MPPPVPTDAWWVDDFNGITVNFDQVLQDVPLDAPNWRVVVGGKLRRILDPGVFENSVRGQTSPLVNTAGSWVDYVPPPFDVANLEGTPAAGFLRFPVNQV